MAGLKSFEATLVQVAPLFEEILGSAISFIRLAGQFQAIQEGEVGGPGGAFGGAPPGTALSARSEGGQTSPTSPGDATARARRRIGYPQYRFIDNPPPATTADPKSLTADGAAIVGELRGLKQALAQDALTRRAMGM